MRRQGLVARSSPDDLVALTKRLCGLHAQVFSSAELTAWARIDGLDRGAVVAECWEHGRLVKQWAMRGTLHLLPGDELGLWHSALSTFDHFHRGAWLRNFGFASKDEVDALVAAVGDALDGQVLTRAELASAVASHTGNPALAEHLTESWGSSLKPAAFQGQLVFAPSTGPNVRFTKPPQLPRPPVDDALDEIARRYLAMYGPARREDFSRWWHTTMMTAARAQKRFERLGDEVAVVDVEGATCWVLRSDLDELSAFEPEKAARLLPLFDQYVVSSNRGIEQLLPQAHRDAVFRQAGWISPVILVDGAVAGVWKHDLKGAKLTVELAPFGKVPKWALKQLSAEAERLRDYLGATELTLRGTS
jgi:hypothetical protein